MTHSTAIILATNAALTALLGWGLARWQKRLLTRRLPDTYQKLRPENWILFLGLAVFWVGLAFLTNLILAQADVRPLERQDQINSGIFAVLAALMAVRVFQSYFSLLGVRPEGLAWWTPGRGRKGAVEIAWKDVARVDASALSNRFLIRTQAGSTFGNYFLGREMPALIDALERHAPKDTLTPKAKTVFEKLARPAKATQGAQK